MSDFYRIHATICKTIAHAKRLQILDILRSGERTVNEIAESMGARPANVSQQLAILRGAGVLKTRRDGNRIFYAVSNPKILQACDLMTQVMLEEAAATRAELRRPPVAAAARTNRERPARRISNRAVRRRA